MEKEYNEDIETSQNNDELENEELETPTGEEDNSDDNSGSDSDELEELKKQNEELMNKNKQLFERLKKTNKSTKSNMSNLREEDLIRISKVASNLDEDDLEILKTIKGESIAEKLDNPMFKAYKKDKQAQERSKASSLQPSKPGIQVQGKSFSDPNISLEEHKKMFNELMS